MKRALIAVGAVLALTTLGGVVYGLADPTTPTATCDAPSYDGTNLNLHCVVPQTTVSATDTVTETATTTETATATVTATETQTVTQTVPGPTTTVTVTTTSAPPPPAYYATGEGVNAGNTGIAGDGVTPGQLTGSGAVTYGTAYNGQTITLKAYSGEVVINGSHITVKDCTLTNGGLNSIGFLMQGSYNTVQNCTITAPSGQSMYEPIWIFGDHNQALNNDISRGENLLTTYGTNVTIAGNYMHDVALDSNPGDHPDGIEIYGGGPTLIDSNRIVEGNLYDSPINVAPYSSYKVQGLTVSNNFLDNGQSMTLFDNQNTSCGGGTQPVGDCLINSRVLHNAFGGHTNPDTNMSFGRYKTLENYEGRPIVSTDAGLAANPNAIEWVANQWEETQTAPALTPNRDGQTALPTCPSPC